MDSTTVKGFHLLERLVMNGGPCGVTELARDTDLTKSNVQRILATLTNLGYVGREPRTSRYFATLKMWEMGNHVRQGDRILRCATGVMKALRADTRETVVLCILDGKDVVYIEKQESDNPIRLSCAVGTRLPALSTATGRVLVAFDEGGAGRKDAVPPTDGERAAGTDPDGRFRSIRETSIETSVGGYRPGVNSVAAPIRTVNGAVCASIAITGPEERLQPDRMAGLVPKLLDAATSISVALGYTGAG